MTSHTRPDIAPAQGLPPAARLGFCCKYIPEDGDAEAARRMNISNVTMAYLARQEPKAAYDKIAAVVAHNLDVLRRQVEHVASRPPVERLHRIFRNASSASGQLQRGQP